MSKYQITIEIEAEDSGLFGLMIERGRDYYLPMIDAAIATFLTARRPQNRAYWADAFDYWTACYNRAAALAVAYEDAASSRRIVEVAR